MRDNSLEDLLSRARQSLTGVSARDFEGLGLLVDIEILLETEAHPEVIRPFARKLEEIVKEIERQELRNDSRQLIGDLLETTPEFTNFMCWLDSVDLPELLKDGFERQIAIGEMYEIT